MLLEGGWLEAGQRAPQDDITQDSFLRFQGRSPLSQTQTLHLSSVPELVTLRFIEIPV